MRIIMKHIPLYRYAGKIKRNWDNIDKLAKPCVEAMFTFNQITEVSDEKVAQAVVKDFLAHASKWRGQIARDTKEQLRRLVEVK
jgi:hypothetical protein